VGSRVLKNKSSVVSQTGERGNSIERKTTGRKTTDGKRGNSIERKTTDGGNTLGKTPLGKKHHLGKNTTWEKQQGLTMHTLAEYQSLLSLTSVNGKMLLINMMLLHHNFLHGFTAFS